MILSGVIFLHNSARLGGGGVALRDSSLSAQNCILIQNNAGSGGALCIHSPLALFSLPVLLTHLDLVKHVLTL